jgi:hypothetical protein
MTGQHRMHRNLKLPSILNTLVAKMHVTLSQLVHEFRSNRHRPEGFRHRIWALMERGKIPVDISKRSDSDVLTFPGLRLCLAFASLQLAV